jgi:VCBS repeat-containing protein
VNSITKQLLGKRLQKAVVGLLLLGLLASKGYAQIGGVPIIAVPPLDQTVKKGGTALFTVVAVSLTEMSYQWYRNSNAIWLATSSTYIRNNVDFADAGFYHVEISNGAGTTESRVATLTVTGNSQPVASDDTYTTPEDMPLTVPSEGVLGNDFDAEGDTLTALLVSNVTHGSLSLNTNGAFTYTPNSNYHGSDSFTYRPRDPVTTGNVATVTIDVTPLYDPPVAVNDSTNTLEDTSVTIQVLGNDYNPDGSFFLITDTATTNGTVVISGDSIFFTPPTNFNGTVVFSYTLSDGTNSNTANVTVTVTAVNDPPVANNDAFSTSEDVTLVIPAAGGVLTNDVDVDSAGLIALLVTSTSNGALSLNSNGSFTYTPNTNFNGIDSFTYRARDGSVTGNVATVSINVMPVNDAPIANNDSTNTLEDVPVTVRVLANDTDIEGGPLSVMSTSTTNGTAVISGSNVVFTPSPNYFGTVVFSYVLSDGTATSTANVTVSIASVNDAPPQATNDSYATTEDVRLTVAMPGVLGNDRDMDNDPFTALIVSNVTRGTLSFNANGSFTYMPSTNYYGTDSFTYRATDGMATGNIATVTIYVNAVNDSPVARSDTTNTSEDTSATIDVLANDTDVEDDFLIITGTSTTNGTAVIKDFTSIVFTPATNFYGTVVMSYTISDGAYSVTTNVTVTVISVNDAPPAANTDNYTTVEDTLLTIAAPGILANDTDVDADPFTAVLVSNVSHGNLTLNANGSFTYTPTANFFGTDSFTYRATDGMATGNVATVTFTVTPVNDAPLPINDVTNTFEDVSVTIRVLANDSDAEGTPLSITSTSTTNGTALVSGTNIVFTPSTNFNGMVVFSYTVSDGTNSATANVSVTVIPVNDVPVASDDAVSTLEDKSVTINVLANDTDAERAPLTVINISSTNGTAVINGTNIVYTPSANYYGTVLFSYTMSDGTNSATAKVTVTVISVNDAPVGNDDAYSTAEDVQLSVPAPGILANDTDIENNPVTALLVSTVSHGSLVLNGNGSFTYTPASNYFGSDSFIYRAWDGSSNSASTTVRLTTRLNTALKIVSAAVVTNGFKLGLVGPTPAAYTILASSNNVNWTPIGSRVAFDGPVEFTDTNAGRSRACFYAATVSSQSTIILEGNSAGGNKLDLRLGKDGSQSFRHGVAGNSNYTVSKVVLRISRQTTLPNANLIFSIGTGTNSGALPGSTVAINPASITNTSAGNSFQTYEIPFTVPVGPLTAGTTYYLNLDFDPTNGARMYLESAGTDTAYPNGSYFRGGSYQPDDAVFELWGQ